MTNASEAGGRGLTILVSAGGTGGGIYPALTVIGALRREAPGCRVHFVGSRGGMEESLVPRDQVDGFHSIQAGPVHGVGPRRLIGSLFRIAAGIAQTWRLVGRLRPDVLFLTGGWVTFPAAVGCWLRRVPLAAYTPDIEPALVVRAISRLARMVMTPADESAAYFPRRARVVRVGYPLRESVLRADRATGIAHFGLEPGRRTLLVWGGSRGARRINEVLAAILPALLDDGWQVIHVAGELDWPAVEARCEALRAEVPEAVAARYHAFPYLRDDMGLALAAADLTVSRAGASILGEYPHFGLPAILVPLAFAWRYQEVNAAYLVRRGAAIRLDNETLDAELLPAIRALVRDPSRLESMREAAAALAGTDDAGVMARHIIGLAKKRLHG